MSLLGYVLLLTSAFCCTAAPATDGSCRGQPERRVDAELQGVWEDESYPENTEAVFSCRPGYVRQGSIKEKCISSQWKSTTKGLCKKKPCGHPGDIPFGSFELINEDSFVFGAVVEYYCDDGYQMVSREKKRQCTASGWSNYPPHCEVRNCPPIEAADSINVISTSYDEEYSVGQVIRFECKDPKLKLSGPSEIFCTSDGNWNLGPPTCVEIICNIENIPNGIVKDSRKKLYKNNEAMQYECIAGFQANKNGQSTCTKDDWNPKPYCEEILCSPYDPVTKGKLVAIKSRYKFGDEIDIECEDGYVLNLEPNKRRVCTANGWSPSTRCVSKKCDKPNIQYGNLGRDYYSYYPKEVKSSIWYYCDSGYQPRSWTKLYCTEAGWSPEPKCLRECTYDAAYFQNGDPLNLKSAYLEGDTVQFRCNPNYQTPNGSRYGERTCLPNGQFSPAKCSVTCKAPQLQHGTFVQIKNEYQNEEFLQYECNKGFMTDTKHIFSKTQCLDGKWSETPRCIRITCEHDHKVYYEDDTIKYTCPAGQRPQSDIGQCYHFGWGPSLVCQELDIICTIPESSNLIPSPFAYSYKINKRVSFSCKGRFVRSGSLESVCKEDGWIPALPTCEEKQVQPPITGPTPGGHEVQDKIPIEPDSATTDSKDEKDKIPIEPDSVATDSNDEKEKCPLAYSPQNVEIVNQREAYYSNDTVTMKCASGYKMYGSPTVKCVKGKWQRPPECIRVRQCEKPRSIRNGIIESPEQEIYVTDDVVKYSCKSGFHISGSDQSTCINGFWSTLPTCTEDACDEAPKIENGITLENKNFNHAERAKYKCHSGYRFKDDDSATCTQGKWMNKPICISTSCKPPPNVPNSRVIGGTKSSYASDEKVTYQCISGYSLQRTGVAQCENAIWINIPECRKTGEQCGPPPTVDYGDTLQVRKANYRNGERVDFRCPEYYILRGNTFVTCTNGIWNEAPVCIEPCTAKERDMEENNIQFKWISDKKLYSKDGEGMDFICKFGYEAPSGTQMRAICQQGKLGYPKCFKSGFCVLQQSNLITNNIHYNLSTVVDHGQTILFQCNEGTLPENKLDAKCEWGKINYPKCAAATSCKPPNVLNGHLKSEQQVSYNSGSYVEFDCNEGYAISVAIKVKCENGQWSKLPECYSPCKISQEELSKHNIQLFSSNDPKIIPDKNYKHGTEISVTCKSGFRRPTHGALVIECNDGEFRYPRCFSGGTCRINQDNVDENNLELDEIHNNDVFYAEGDIIQYKCKNGFYYSGKPTGTCSEGTMIYPKCTEESSV